MLHWCKISYVLKPVSVVLWRIGNDYLIGALQTGYTYDAWGTMLSVKDANGTAITSLTHIVCVQLCVQFNDDVLETTFYNGLNWIIGFKSRRLHMGEGSSRDTWSFLRIVLTIYEEREKAVLKLNMFMVLIKKHIWT